MFDTIAFWCEFPDMANWDVINKLNFKTEIGIAAETEKEYNKCRSKIKNKNIKTIYWPTLSKKEGYWFSGYTKKTEISKLLKINEKNIKIDLEPKIPNIKYKNYLLLLYLLRLLFKKPKNYQYLKQTIEKLNNKNLILSTLPFPKFLNKKLGIYVNPQHHKINFFIYNTLIKHPFKSILGMYYKSFIKRKLKQYKNISFAVGCTGPGIFEDEPIYKNIEEFKKDLDFMANLNVKNLVIFEISSLSNRPDAEEWFELIQTYIKK